MTDASTAPVGKRATFTRMVDADAQDFVFLDAFERRAAGAVGERLLSLLAELSTAPSGYRIGRGEHSLQAATRAYRDGADADWIVTALFHDVGDVFAPYNHDEMVAALLRPYLREQCVWVVGHHGLFLRYYYAHHFGGDREARRKHRSHPYYDDCVEFCDRWDQESFDPSYDAMPLEAFRPTVDEVFAREPFDPAVIAPGKRLPLVVPSVARERAKGA